MLKDDSLRLRRFVHKAFFLTGCPSALSLVDLACLSGSFRHGPNLPRKT